jgi:hypothetical protein
MADTDNAKPKREFKKLSKCMGDKLDNEKERYVARPLCPLFSPLTLTLGHFTQEH